MEDKRTIRPQPDSLPGYFRKLKSFLPLVSTFAKRDIKVKYSQTVIGIGWTIIQPLAALMIFTFFFGYILHWKAGETPYALYVYSGLLSWNLFTYIVFQGSSSILDAGNMIKKIYFPKIILPLSKVLVALIELAINLALLVLLMIYYHVFPTWRILILPLVVVTNLLPALTIVIWASALSYKARDIIHIIPFLMYFGIWITPVFFTKDILPSSLQFIWSINPMTGIVEGWRWCILPDWQFNSQNLISVLSLIPILIVGFIIYIRNESKYSDFV